MARLRVSTETERFRLLDARLAALRALIAEPEVDLVELGKSFASLAAAIEAAATERGPSSVRFRAVTKALDLRTPRSLLEAFVGDVNVP
ncbi:MAG: hypothetical protein AB7S26_22320 [Sandaracinaceae bacterium]